MSIKERIKQLADDSSLTVAELERKLDIANGTIGKWDRQNPGMDKVEKVAKFFDVSTDYLIGLESYEDMKLAQARRDFATDTDEFVVLYRKTKNELSEESQEAYKTEMKNFSDYLKLKYSKKE